MYPDLSYFFHDLFGTSPDNALSIVKTFGMFLALAFLTAGFFLYMELRRREQLGWMAYTIKEEAVGEKLKVSQLLTSVVLGFVIGFKLLYILTDFAAFQADAVGVLFSGKGHWIGGLLAAAAFGGYRYWQGKKNELPKPKIKKVKVMASDRVGDIVIVAAITGILGAKIFALIETPAKFAADPIGQLISPAGLAIYGGLIGGIIGVSLFVKYLKIPLLQMMDASAPSIMAAYGVGRMGCQFSGDGDWGIPVKGPNEFRNEAYDYSQAPSWVPDWLWSQSYPRNVAKEGQTVIPDFPYEYNTMLDIPVFPTPIYEMIMAFAIFAILWALRKRLSKIPSLLFFLFMIFNGIERFVIEKIRINSYYDVLGFQMTQAEIIAVIFVLIGIFGGLWAYQRAKKNNFNVEVVQQQKLMK